MRYLYIDDSKADQALFAIHFKDENITIDFVNTIDEGLNLLAEHPYDLIICDLMIPGEDGMGFAKKLSAMEFTIPLILTSGVSALSIFDQYHGLINYLGFALKPVKPQDIRDLFQKKLAGCGS